MNIFDSKQSFMAGPDFCKNPHLRNIIRNYIPQKKYRVKCQLTLKEYGELLYRSFYGEGNIRLNYTKKDLPQQRNDSWTPQERYAYLKNLLSGAATMSGLFRLRKVGNKMHLDNFDSGHRSRCFLAFILGEFKELSETLDIDWESLPLVEMDVCVNYTDAEMGQAFLDRNTFSVPTRGEKIDAVSSPLTKKIHNYIKSDGFFATHRGRAFRFSGSTNDRGNWTNLFATELIHTYNILAGNQKQVDSGNPNIKNVLRLLSGKYTENEIALDTDKVLNLAFDRLINSIEIMLSLDQDRSFDADVYFYGIRRAIDDIIQRYDVVDAHSLHKILEFYEKKLEKEQDIFEDQKTLGRFMLASRGPARAQKLLLPMLISEMENNPKKYGLRRK